MSVMNVLDLSCFQSLVGNDKPTSMSDLLAAVRLLEENISYAQFLASAQTDTSRKNLYEDVRQHLTGDLNFIEDAIKRQLAIRHEQDAKIAEAKEKALAAQEFEELKAKPGDVYIDNETGEEVKVSKEAWNANLKEHLHKAIEQKKNARTSK